MTSPAVPAALLYNDKVMNGLSVSSMDLNLKVDDKLLGNASAVINQTLKIDSDTGTIASGVPSNNTKYEHLTLGETSIKIDNNVSYSIQDKIRSYMTNTKSRFISSAHREKVKFLDEVFWAPDNKDGDTEEKIKKAKLIIQSSETEKVEFLEFIVTSIQAQDSESVNVFNAFNMSIIQSFGRNVPVYTMMFALEQNTKRPWYGNFMFLYENSLRASQLIRKGYTCTLELAGDVYTIVPVSFNRSRTSDEKYSLTATMTFYVIHSKIFDNPKDLSLSEKSGVSRAVGQSWLDGVPEAAGTVTGSALSMYGQSMAQVTSLAQVLKDKVPSVVSDTTKYIVQKQEEARQKVDQNIKNLDVNNLYLKNGITGR